jgi:hypothetical protein
MMWPALALGGAVLASCGPDVASDQLTHDARSPNQREIARRQRIRDQVDGKRE